MTAELEIGRAEHLSAADTAKLVRAALRRAFPDYDFTVKSRTYAGGTSIDVAWYDGPPSPVVDAVVKQYQGGGFDGMIDMAFSYEHWLEPDGTAHPAGSPGTSGSGGTYEPVIESPRSPGARLVRFGANHILTQRDLTPEARAIIEKKATAKYGPLDDTYQGGDYFRVQIERRWLFPPCRHTFNVVRGYRAGKVTEAAGLTSLSAAEKKARELQKARNPRGYRYVEAHRS